MCTLGQITSLNRTLKVPEPMPQATFAHQCRHFTMPRPGIIPACNAKRGIQLSAMHGPCSIAPSLTGSYFTTPANSMKHREAFSMPFQNYTGRFERVYFMSTLPQYNGKQFPSTGGAIPHHRHLPAAPFLPGGWSRPVFLPPLARAAGGGQSAGLHVFSEPAGTLRADSNQAYVAALWTGAVDVFSSSSDSRCPLS